MENEFTDYHKDSFVRGEPEKKQAQPEKKPIPPPGPLPSAESDNNLDDYVPEKVGKVVDNVFGKLDNLVNDAADYLFGNKKKGGGLLEGDQFEKQKAPQKPGQIPPLKPQAQQPPVLKPLTPQAPPAAPVEAPPPPAAKAAPKAPAKPAPAPQVQTLSTLQGSRKPEMIRPVMPESKPAKQAYDGPMITRTTSISELELPLEILDDPDLPKYFDQMKLYEAKVVEGGLCNLPQFEATHSLRKGKWKHEFRVRFEDLKKLEPGIYPMEMAKSRFHGMRPVYKAQAWRYPSEEALRKAIEDDVNAYLKGKEDKHFHPFIYQVVSTVIR